MQLQNNSSQIIDVSDPVVSEALDKIEHRVKELKSTGSKWQKLFHIFNFVYLGSSDSVILTAIFAFNIFIRRIQMPLE